MTSAPLLPPDGPLTLLRLSVRAGSAADSHRNERYLGAAVRELASVQPRPIPRELGPLPGPPGWPARLPPPCWRTGYMDEPPQARRSSPSAADRARLMAAG